MAEPALPPLIMGGAGFSYQLHPSPQSLPVLDIIQHAFALGLRSIDTSPYYEPSEELLGAALSSTEISSVYRREQYQIMTKCGRIASDQFDYSPAWIRKSVARSLQRFNTTYLDVVFCHDVEFVSLEEAATAVGTLFDLKRQGMIKNVGISAYDIDSLIAVSQRVLADYSQPIDVVQNWAQLSLQNTRLEVHGLPALKAAGVKAVCNASPLACGLLRSGGVPVGKLGDWHPAPAGLRAASQRASTWVEEKGDSLASVGLRYALVRSLRCSEPGFALSTITGISTIADLVQNVMTASRILKRLAIADRELTLDPKSLIGCTVLDENAAAADELLFDSVRRILDRWVDYDFSASPTIVPVEEKQSVVSVTTTPYQ
ncbi:uncharacterized protein HMPREF1541_08882 [Cyphellophora europaea CBS 101466]|uniref:NADP-dependent oxidoreductase domain-containing protein n=1 Tax=Cyphellophora europaea (strain CBS 101466) TaxID=1220924 RepID=W2RLJ5_CYPE1|nr:uncharacterized protein HMPREF1541_08882 [Cyphellophora europaea CBS 101466]ETN36604.1 hypothetical protein HMPREF1541_08882 [Cyphellophora europaea CBS 101466]